MFFNTPDNGLWSKLVRDEGGGFIILAQDGKAAREEATTNCHPVYDVFDKGTWSRVKFSKWWHDPVLAAANRRVLTREQLVLAMANQDGGAHIDRMMDEAYASVTGKQDVKVTYHVGGVSASAKHGRHYSAVRQIAYEVQMTLDAELSDLLPEPLTFPSPLPADSVMRMPSEVQVKMKYEREHLEGVLKSLEEAGEGDSLQAREIKRQIFWET